MGGLLTFGGPSPVQAQAVPDFPGGANFSAYGTGVGIHADVIDAGAEGPRIVDGEIGVSAAAFDTAGVGTDLGIVNEMNMPIVPKAGATDAPVDAAGKESYGKGSGVEVGLGSDLPNVDDANQIKLTQVGAASEPPVRSDGEDPLDSASTGLVREALIEVPGGPLLYADVAETNAGAVWSNKTCIIGQPLAIGSGVIADAQVLGAADNADTPNDLEGAIVELDSELGDEAIDTQTFTYLIANKNAAGAPDGTYGVVSETRMIFAPITIAEDEETGVGPLQINIAGTWRLRVTATGKGPATVFYGVGDVSPETKVIEVLSEGVSQGALTLQQIFMDEGLNLPAELEPILELSVGEDPRAIAAPDTVPDDTAPPVTTVTEGSAAVDVLRLGLLQLEAPAAGPSLAGIRVGHMEASVKVPAGGFRCRFPVSKTGPSQVTAGQEFEWTIKIPSDAHALDGVACDIVGILAVDNLRTLTGSPGARITSATTRPGQPEAVISNNGQTVTWSNLGAYKNGDPPIEVKVRGLATGQGTFENVVDVTATLGNCNGGGLLTGEALASFLQGAALLGEGAVTGGAQITGTGLTGGITAVVLAAALPATGGRDNLYVGLAIAALLSAAGVYRLTRRATSTG